MFMLSVLKKKKKNIQFTVNCHKNNATVGKKW